MQLNAPDYRVKKKTAMNLLQFSPTTSPVGYMVSAKVLLIDLLEEKQGRTYTAACFRPTAERLSDIAQNGQTRLQNASDKDLTEFSE